MIITKENSPHIRGKASVTRMMADVLIALAPTLIFAFVVYPAQAAINLTLSLFIKYSFVPSLYTLLVIDTSSYSKGK